MLPAHDNPILNYEESLLIFNHVAASIRFIKALELKIKARQRQQTRLNGKMMRCFEWVLIRY